MKGHSELPGNALVDSCTYNLTLNDLSMLAAHEDLRQPEETVSSYALRLVNESTLPDGLSSAISSFADKGNDLGGLLLRGFEIDVDGPNPERAQAIGEFTLLSVAARIGLPYGYASQRNGEIIQNLTPKPEDAFKQLGTGSQTVLNWHTEDAHTEQNCDVISLLCLRGADDAATLLSQIRPDELHPAVRDALERDDYVVRSDGSYNSASQIKTPVIRSTERSHVTRYDPLYTECLNPSAQSALNELTRHIDKNAVSIVLQKGDLLLIDNHTNVHARSAFTPKYNGKDRWLQRAGILSKQVDPDLLSPQDKLVINI
ncbi:MAG TPA: TauD/TfdA family dioxygenase [Candidatus Saccharimonadales bacterium]